MVNPETQAKLRELAEQARRKPKITTGPRGLALRATVILGLVPRTQRSSVPAVDLCHRAVTYHFVSDGARGAWVLGTSSGMTAWWPHADQAARNRRTASSHSNR